MVEADYGDKVILVAKDGEEVKVDPELVEPSGLIQTLLEDVQDEPLPLPEVSKATLDKIILYLTILQEHQQQPEIERPLRSTDLADEVGPDFANFIDIAEDKREELFDLFNAANYLDIRSLFQLTAAKIALQIKGKDEAQMRTYFGVDNDLSKDEEELIQRSFKWTSE